jgi:hypothetical protein
MKFAILISAGTPSDYSRKVGWDSVCETRDEAETLAQEARRNAGWEAKVIPLSESEAQHWHESPGERLDRQHAEFESRLRAGTLYR